MIVAAVPSASATPPRQVKREAIHRSSHNATRPQERPVAATRRTAASAYRVDDQTVRHEATLPGGINQ